MQRQDTSGFSRTKVNPFMLSGLFYLWIGSVPIEGLSDELLLPCFIKIPVLNASSVDSDQVPHSAVSDLGLHCLPMSLL